MSLQDNTNNSFMDFMHYQWIFNEAEQDKKTDEQAAEKESNASGSQFPSQKQMIK